MPNKYTINDKELLAALKRLHACIEDGVDCDVDQALMKKLIAIHMVDNHENRYVITKIGMIIIRYNSPTLTELLQRAAQRGPMTSLEEYEQRVSWVYGQLNDDSVTREEVERRLDVIGVSRPTPKKEESRDILASRLIDAWCADKGKPIPWAKAVQIVAIVTKQTPEERDVLLHMGDEGGACGMCGRTDTPPTHMTVLIERLQLMYGLLWRINEDRAAPIPLLTAVEASRRVRHILKGILDTHQRAAGIRMSQDEVFTHSAKA